MLAWPPYAEVFQQEALPEAPAWILAGIASGESGFDPLAYQLTETEDSRGLLQINCNVHADWIRDAWGYSCNDLFNPRINIKVGAIYYALCVQRIREAFPALSRDEPYFWALLAYNMGIRGATKSLKTLPALTWETYQAKYGTTRAAQIRHIARMWTAALRAKENLSGSGDFLEQLLKAGILGLFVYAIVDYIS